MFAGLPLRARGDADFWIRVSRNAMACRFEVTLASRDAAWVTAARDALDGVDALEDRLSLFRETSQLAELNRRAALESFAVDAQFFADCRAYIRDTEARR